MRVDRFRRRVYEPHSRNMLPGRVAHVLVRVLLPPVLVVATGWVEASPATATPGTVQTHVNGAPTSDGVNLRACANTGNGAPYCDLLIDRMPNGAAVTMRCWEDSFSDLRYLNPAWTSKRWFYVTEDQNPNHYAGFVYSMLVFDQTTTPMCTRDLLGQFPNDPMAGTVTIGQGNGGVAVAVNQGYGFPLGPASVFCHAGTGYPKGGTVSARGVVTVSEISSTPDGVEPAFRWTTPLCASSGTMWIGVQAANGLAYYSNVITVSAPSPPPRPPTAGYLGGVAGAVSFISSPGDYVSAEIYLGGVGARNYGETDLAVQQLAVGVTSPTGARVENQCVATGTSTPLVNLVVHPGQEVDCDITYTPDVVGTWSFDLDWQDTAGVWHLNLYAPFSLDIGAYPRPANDDFGNAQPIEEGTFTGDTSDATSEPGEQPHDSMGTPPHQSLWYRFTASRTGRAWVTADNRDGGITTEIGAYSGDHVDALTTLATWDGSNADEIAFPVTAGQSYSVAIAGYSEGDAGGFSATLRVDPIVRPVNDDLVNAVTLVPGTMREVDLGDATVQLGEPRVDPSQSNNGTVWYGYTPSSRQTISISDPHGEDAKIALFSRAADGSLTQIDHSWLQGGGTGAFAPVAVLQPGMTYLVAVDRYYQRDAVSGVDGPHRVEVLLSATNIVEPASVYTPLTPKRVLDTAGHIGATGPIAGKSDISVNVATATGVPSAQIAAVAVEVTAAGASASGYLVAYGANDPRPATSSLNYLPGAATTNAVVAQVEAGRIAIGNGGVGPVDATVYVVGVYRINRNGYHPLGPVRIVDTRSGLGVARAGAIAAHGTVRVRVAGAAGIPKSKVAAVVANVTVTQAGAAGSLTVYPDGETRPDTSTVSFAAASTTANLAVVGFGTGYLNLYNASSQPVDAIVDVQGYHSGGVGGAVGGINGVYVERLLDTSHASADRSAAPVPARGTVSFSVSPSGVPAADDFVSAILNVTARGSGTGPVVVFPYGASRPSVPTLQTTANTPVSGLTFSAVRNGRCTIYNGSNKAVNLVVDMVAFTLAP